MPFDVLEKPICYSTFQTRKDASDRLLRCSQCKCAWYSSQEEQRANWDVHKKVCKRPDYDIIGRMNADQCVQALKRHSSQCDHNTAAIFERLFDLMRRASDEGSDSVGEHDLSDLGLWTHSFSRLQSPVSQNLSHDYLESIYRRAWACPGMPQLMHFSDLRSSTYRRMMRDFPEGQPMFSNENDEYDFDMEYENDRDQSGEDVAWFVIGFLVRSCVWGSLAMASNHDGRGTLRDTRYSAAALRRVTEIFSTKLVRDSVKKALYPVPGLLLNVAENKRKEFLRLLDTGVGLAIIEWADLDYGKDTLQIMTEMNMEELSDHAKLDLLGVCCNIFGRHASYPWSSAMDETKDKELVDLCFSLAANLISNSSDLKELLLCGMNRRPEMASPQWIENTKGRERMVVAFLYEKMVSGVDICKRKSLKASLKEWRGVEVWEKTKYAGKVMEAKHLREFDEEVEDLRKLILKTKLKLKTKQR